MSNNHITQNMKILVAILFCLVFYSKANPVHFGQNGFDCHGIICPNSTIYCIKNTEISYDESTLTTIIICKDLQGNVLNSSTETIDQ